MARRTILSLLAAVASAAALTAFVVRAARPAAAGGNFSEWGPPVNLGSVVNSTAADQHPAVSKDGLSLYFTSSRPGGQGGLDLWVAQRADEDPPWTTPVNLGATVNS